jgi:hypothetical protein
MKIAILVIAIVGVLWSLVTTTAQHQPYAGLHARPIKALSEQQIADLKAGRGMGLALAAELNGYPGPIHVIELSTQLGLTPEQHKKIENFVAAMKAEAIPIGEELIGLEANLDRLFASRSITEDLLKTTVNKIGLLQGNLRAAHLRYHLLTLNVLTLQQAQRYSELRGYRHADDNSAHHHQR